MTVPKSRLPRRAAQEYFRNIKQLIEEDRQRVWRAWQEEIRPRIYGYRRLTENPRLNSLRVNDDPLSEIRRILERLRDMAERQTFAPFMVERYARSFVTQINLLVRSDFRRQVVSVLGFDPTAHDPLLSSFLETAIQENVSWIKSIATEYHNKIESIITQGVRRGQSINEMAGAITDVGGVSLRRARFIARDQLGSLYGDLTKARQTSLGLKKFRWRTSQDERVRDSHESLDGQIFTWKDGAVNERGERIWPGTDYNCRCVAEPLEEEMLELAEVV